MIYARGAAAVAQGKERIFIFLSRGILLYLKFAGVTLGMPLASARYLFLIFFEWPELL